MRDDTSGAGEDDAGAGDPVCWLQFVCESCGALAEGDGAAHRPGCERATAAARD
jgi:hypothetical protein